MSYGIHLQQTFAATAEAVFQALTQAAALECWFAEHAFVSLQDGEYRFWGRYTPETPSSDAAGFSLEEFVPNRRLRFRWPLRGGASVVELRLKEDDAKTTLGLWHRDIPRVEGRGPGCYSFEDLWCAWLENLRRYLDGKSILRSDFSRIEPGDVEVSVEIDGPPAAVWNVLVDPKQRNRLITNDAAEVAKVESNWVDWGDEVGALVVRALEPERKLELEWIIEGVPTLVTWTIENNGGRTRLILAHSGFAPDVRTDGEWAGWLNYVAWIQSLVEYGLEWLPPVKDISEDLALYQSAAVLARQSELIGDGDDEWA